MARLVKLEEFQEGKFFCRWLQSRLLKNNKNVLGAELGPTGSGKSYRDLRKVEIWYRDYLKREFPVDNICFGASAIMQRLTSGELERGDILIMEEAGANLGSLDFQSKVSKMFTYVLQSFRSMNIGIFFNLPYLSMLNKQARMLLHYSSESLGIDFEKGVNKCKLFYHQVNQATGKVYKKYPRAKVGGRVRTLKKINWSMPSERLVDAYERKKATYLSELTSDYVEELKKLEWEKNAKMGRKELSPKQKEVMDYLKEGKTLTEIAEILGIDVSSVWARKETMKKNGFGIEIPQSA